MNDAACPARVMTGLMFSECSTDGVRPATFSPAPPNTMFIPRPASLLAIGSETCISGTGRPF